MADAYLLDTTVASIAWDGRNKDHQHIRQQLAVLGDDALFVCAISLGEVEYGLQVSPAADASRHEAVRNAMSQYAVLAIDHHTTPYYSSIRGELFKRYSPRDKRGRLNAKRPEELIDSTTARELGIQENDLWIVSVAIQYDLRLITRDKRMERILEIARDIHGYDRALVWPASASPPSSNDPTGQQDAEK